jgi:putative transposase
MADERDRNLLGQQPATSLWSTVSHKHSYRHIYTTKTKIAALVDKRIRLYNSERRHSAIAMLSPAIYEKSLRVAT